MRENKKIRLLTENAIIASLYVVLTLINPVGWLMFQFRVSEILAILPFYDKKYRLGILVGVAIANFFSPIGIIDVIVGVVVGFISYYILNYYIKNIWLNVIQYAVVAGLLVSSELFFVFNSPYFITFISITLSTLMTGIIGVYVCKKLLKILKGRLKSWR